MKTEKMDELLFVHYDWTSRSINKSIKLRCALYREVRVFSVKFAMLALTVKNCLLTIILALKISSLESPPIPFLVPLLNGLTSTLLGGVPMYPTNPSQYPGMFNLQRGLPSYANQLMPAQYAPNQQQQQQQQQPNPTQQPYPNQNSYPYPLLTMTPPQGIPFTPATGLLGAGRQLSAGVQNFITSIANIIGSLFGDAFGGTTPGFDYSQDPRLQMCVIIG